MNELCGMYGDCRPCGSNYKSQSASWRTRNHAVVEWLQNSARNFTARSFVARIIGARQFLLTLPGIYEMEEPSSDNVKVLEPDGIGA
jgi:hypothetical protein